MKLSKRSIYLDFITAIFEGKFTETKSLLKNVNLNSNNNEPIKLAIACNKQDIVKLLIDSGTQIDDNVVLECLYHDNKKILKLLKATTPKFFISKEDISITTKHKSLGEQRAAIKLRFLLNNLDLSPWLFTDEFIIDESKIPHSHPVITLNTRFLGDDDLFLSVVVHEQLHWHLKENAKIKKCMKLLSEEFHSIPVGKPDGDENLDGSLLHIMVIACEWSALKKLIGLNRAFSVISFWSIDHYKKLYELVIENYEKIRDIMDLAGITCPCEEDFVKKKSNLQLSKRSIMKSSGVLKYPEPFFQKTWDLVNGTLRELYYFGRKNGYEELEKYLEENPKVFSLDFEFSLKDIPGYEKFNKKELSKGKSIQIIAEDIKLTADFEGSIWLLTLNIRPMDLLRDFYSFMKEKMTGLKHELTHASQDAFSLNWFSDEEKVSRNIPKHMDLSSPEPEDFYEYITSPIEFDPQIITVVGLFLSKYGYGFDSQDVNNFISTFTFFTTVKKKSEKLFQLAVKKFYQLLKEESSKVNFTENVNKKESNMKLSKRADKDLYLNEKPLTDDIDTELTDTPFGVAEKITSEKKESGQPIFPKGFYNIKEWDGSTDVVYLVPIVAEDNFAGYRMTYPDGETNEISSSYAEELVVSPLSTVEAELRQVLKKFSHKETRRTNMKLSKRANMMKKAIEKDQFNTNSLLKDLDENILTDLDNFKYKIRPLAKRFPNDNKMLLIRVKLTNAEKELRNIHNILYEFSTHNTGWITDTIGPGIYDDIDKDTLEHPPKLKFEEESLTSIPYEELENKISSRTSKLSKRAANVDEHPDTKLLNSAIDFCTRSLLNASNAKKILKSLSYFPEDVLDDEFKQLFRRINNIHDLIIKEIRYWEEDEEEDILKTNSRKNKLSKRAQDFDQLNDWFKTEKQLQQEDDSVERAEKKDLEFYDKDTYPDWPEKPLKEVAPDELSKASEAAATLNDLAEWLLESEAISTDEYELIKRLYDKL